MKRLILIRHAKSSWDSTTTKDFDRPLNNRGELSLPVMAKTLTKLNLTKLSVLSSSALRAKQTAVGICSKIGFNLQKINFIDNLYHSSPKTMCTYINKGCDANDTVLLFAHNPGITDAVSYFSGHEISNMPTCGIVYIDFDIQSWSLVSNGLGMFKHFDYPKNYT